MAWTFVPTTGSSEWFQWRKYIQLWRALRERYAALNNSLRWPAGNIAYYTGTVTAITETTVTDAAQTWSGSREGAGPFWFGYDPPGTDSDYLPSNYTLVIDPDADDPWSVVIVDITAAESGNVLTTDNIADYVVAGAIPSLASLVGKTYCIISGQTTDTGFGLWWSTRWPAYPNAQEHWKGTTTRGSAVTLTETLRTDGALVDVATKRLVATGAAQSWTVDRFLGYDVLVYGSDDRLHRERITGNSADTLQWDGTTPTTISLDFATTIKGGTFKLAFNVDNGKYEWSEGGAHFTIIVTGTSWTGSGTHSGLTTDFAGTIDGSRQFVVTSAGSYGATVTGEIPDHWYPTGEYVIVEADARAWPGRDSTRSRLDYGGYTDSRAATYPDDSIGAGKIAAATITLEEFNPMTLACETTSDTIAFDADVITLDVEGCELYDKHWSPNLFKSLRQIQVTTEEFAPLFIEEKEYDGADDIHVFTLAEWFYKSEINHGDATVTGPDGSGNYSFTADTAYAGYTVVWTILNDDGSVATSGSGTVTAVTGKVALGGAEYADHDDKAIKYSATWTRRWPRRHRWMFDKTCFIPDVDEGAPVDPPSVIDFALSGSHGVGLWTHRSKSLNYAEFTQYGVIGDTGPAFVAGEASRYIGDDWYHGVLGTFDDDGSSAVIDYWHNLAVKEHPEDAQDDINAQLIGTATAGSDVSLTSVFNWWDDWYAGSGDVLHTESGTASSGGSTSLTDNTKDITLEAGQFWIAERFNGFTAPYVGFVVEVQSPDDGLWYRRVITGCTFSSNVPTIAWADALPFATSGRPYRIREPKFELNRWQGRRLKLTFAGGEVVYTTITHSDDTTLYFDRISGTVTPGTGFEILEPQVGTVWLFTTSEPAATETYVKIDTSKWWVKPTGSDDSPRGNWTPKPWRDNARYNQPTTAKGYGKARRGDFTWLAFYSEIYRGINALRWTMGGGTYYSREDAGVAEENFNDLFDEEGQRIPPDDDGERANAVTSFEGQTPIEAGTTPYAYSEAAMTEEFISIRLEKQYAYFQPNDPSTLLEKAIEVFVRAGINAADAAPFNTTTGLTRGEASFAANGSGTEWHKYKRLHTVAAGAAIPRLLIGTTDVTTAPTFGRQIPVYDNQTEPNPWTDTVLAGWYPLNTVAIHKWDVAGGFTFVD